MIYSRSADHWSAKYKIEAQRSGLDFERKKEPEDMKLPRLFTETGEAEWIRLLLTQASAAVMMDIW